MKNMFNYGLKSLCKCNTEFFAQGFQIARDAHARYNIKQGLDVRAFKQSFVTKDRNYEQFVAQTGLPL